VIAADERKVLQVLFNLLTNAAKFTPDGGRIDVRAELVDGEVRVSVRDTGVGIAPEDLGRIFEEFSQAGGIAREIEGTGLGLPLARRMVELHGGRLTVESVVGAGSTFTFALPLAVDANRAFGAAPTPSK
jgi:signal transduction histidine kinase